MASIASIPDSAKPLTCASTHCERRQECASPHECTGSAKREIPFTQYVAPNGRRVKTSIAVSPAVADAAEAIMARGLVFESEILGTGQVSLTIADPEEGDLDIRVVSNGPGVRDAVEDLISRFGQEA